MQGGKEQIALLASLGVEMVDNKNGDDGLGDQ